MRINYDMVLVIAVIALTIVFIWTVYSGFTQP